MILDSLSIFFHPWVGMVEEPFKGIRLITPKPSAKVQAPVDIADRLAVGQFLTSKLLAIPTDMAFMPATAESFIGPNLATRPTVVPTIPFLLRQGFLPESVRSSLP